MFSQKQLDSISYLEQLNLGLRIPSLLRQIDQRSTARAHYLTTVIKKIVLLGKLISSWFISRVKSRRISLSCSIFVSIVDSIDHSSFHAFFRYDRSRLTKTTHVQIESITFSARLAERPTRIPFVRSSDPDRLYRSSLVPLQSGPQATRSDKSDCQP